MITDDQDVWRLKMGRFSDADEHLYARLLRFRAPRSDGLSSRALSWRIRHVEGNWRLNDGPQAVVKVAGSRKSRSGVRASIRYVARLRSHDRDEPPVFDEFGRPISRDHVLKVMEEWDLESDADNRSATARLRPETSLPERRRLRNVQAWHFIFSILGDDGEQVLEPLRRAAAATIDAAFTRLGHRVIWTVHSDCPGRPHVHAIVKSKSDFGGRLRCDIHGDL